MNCQSLFAPCHRKHLSLQNGNLKLFIKRLPIRNVSCNTYRLKYSGFSTLRFLKVENTVRSYYGNLVRSIHSSSYLLQSEPLHDSIRIKDEVVINSFPTKERSPKQIQNSLNLFSSGFASLMKLKESKTHNLRVDSTTTTTSSSTSKKVISNLNKPKFKKEMSLEFVRSLRSKEVDELIGFALQHKRFDAIYFLMDAVAPSYQVCSLCSVCSVCSLSLELVIIPGLFCLFYLLCIIWLYYQVYSVCLLVALL